MRLLALLAAGLLAGSVMAEDKKDEKKGKESLYFPVVKGTKTVFVSKVGDATRETTDTVTDVTQKDGVYAVSVDSDRGNGSVFSYVHEVSAKGVFQKSFGGVEAKEPMPMLKAGGKAGDTWEAEVSGSGGVGQRTFILGKEEEEAPAGKFKAIRVDSGTTPARGPATEAGLWFAPQRRDGGGRGHRRQPRDDE